MIQQPAKRANRRLPWKLIEEILLNLPHKSLVRFSTVSKSWNSMIFDPVFVRKHKNRAALLRRHRLVVYTNDYDNVHAAAAAAACFLAPISSDLRIKVRNRGYGSCPSFSVFSNARDGVLLDFAGQFKGKPYLRAYCDELWCVEVKKSLFLWNPSMRNIVQLPRPSSFTGAGYIYDSMYGLAYDSVNDDYKILKIRKHSTELYSLKNNCWRKIEPVSYFRTSKGRCEFVAGRFHWAAGARIIAYFDLSSEMYGEVALPHDYDNEGVCRKLEVVALRGMLCASMNYCYSNEDGEAKGRFVLWVMEEYGVEKSWTKRFDFMIPNTTVREDWCCNPEELTPLYLSDNNDLLVKMYICCANEKYILMYRNGEARPTKIVKYEKWNDYYTVDAFLFVESLITHNNFSKKR